MKRTLGLIAVCCTFGLAWGAPIPVGKLRTIDLQSKANQKLAADSEGLKGNNLKELRVGAQTMGDVLFSVGEGFLQLGSMQMDEMPEKIEGIAVDGAFVKLHLLQGTCYGGGPNQEGSKYFVKDDTLIGEYRVNYEDKTSATIPIVYGKDVRDWFFVDGEKGVSRGQVSWKGDNEYAKEVGARIRLYQTSWDNPHPGKMVVSIDFISKKDDTVCAPFCVAITLEKK
jgi:hypothetical protein